MIRIKSGIFILINYICVTLSGVAQIVYEYPDSSLYNIQLDDVEISVSRKLPVMDMNNEPGKFAIGAEALNKTAGFLGVADPVRTLQSLPAVSSSDCISGGIYVQGSENAHNLVRIDGMEIYNPMHLLGLFSVFNTPHFESFDIDLTPDLASSGNFVGADIAANTTWNAASRTKGEVSVGIIESDGSLNIPLVKNLSSISISARATYVNALFGDAIKVENAPLKYGFQDYNATYLQKLGSSWKLKISAFYSHDKMDVKDPNYSSDIDLGWCNVAFGAVLRNLENQIHTIGYSRFVNNMNIKFVDIDKDMPSDVSSLSYSGLLKLGIFDVGGGLTYRHVNPQYSDQSNAETMYSSNAIEARIGTSADLALNGKMHIKPGVKLTYYHAGGFSKVYFLPSLSIRYNLYRNLGVEASFGRRVQFTHKIEESAMGLPTDFWINADSHCKPLTSNNFNLGLNSRLGNTDCYIGAYYRCFSNLVDWVGNLFSMISANYEPLGDVVLGKGRAIGVSAMLKSRIGPVDGWLSYTISKCQQRFPEQSNRWYDYSHDRTHDLKINLSCRIFHGVVLSASFVYATGNPYTEALYGYMIGENLILEFKEHNSSRLPPMHRLDLGLSWTFFSGPNLIHSLNIGVFNAYGHENIMFKSFSYTVADGIQPTKWSMSYILPSISYKLKF